MMKKRLSLLLLIVLTLNTFSVAMGESLEERISQLEIRIEKLENLLFNGGSNLDVGEFLYEYVIEDKKYSTGTGSFQVYCNGFEIFPNTVLVNFTVDNKTNVTVILASSTFYFNNSISVETENEITIPPNSIGHGYATIDLTEATISDLILDEIFLVEVRNTIILADNGRRFFVTGSDMQRIKNIAQLIQSDNDGSNITN